MTAEAPQEPGFPRIYAVAKWLVIVSLTLLGIAAAAFWTLVFTGFSASGFKAVDPKRGADEVAVITPECAWPLSVNDQNARAVCRMFYNLSPEQRAEVVRARK